jgi:predicted PurR-regulated permease PerM
VKRFFANPTVRGLAIVALISFGVVALSLESAVATVGGILRIAFYLAVAFFLFLVWRERRGDLEAWAERRRRVFYAAVAIAVVDVGMLIGLSPSGPEAVVFVVVLLACAYAIWRVWRDEHRYV